MRNVLVYNRVIYSLNVYIHVCGSIKLTYIIKYCKSLIFSVPL